ncbi:hypothetical protein D3C71_2074300 [compost metagenome]
MGDRQSLSEMLCTFWQLAIIKAIWISRSDSRSKGEPFACGWNDLSANCWAICGLMKRWPAKTWRIAWIISSRPAPLVR